MDNDKVGWSDGTQHLQTHFWHCDIVLRYSDISMSFLSQNIRDFHRVMLFDPELCQTSHNTSHNYVSKSTVYCKLATNYWSFPYIGYCLPQSDSLDTE